MKTFLIFAFGFVAGLAFGTAPTLAFTQGGWN